MSDYDDDYDPDDVAGISAAAYARAAETVRRYGLGENGRIFMLMDDQPDSAGHFANLEDHRAVLAQRDALAGALLDAIRDYYDPHMSLADIVHIIEAKPCVPDWQTAAESALRLAGRLPQSPTEERTQE